MVNLVKKKIKGKIYWYIGESKRIEGKVKRIWQKYLGPADKVAKQLIEGVAPQEVDVLDMGLCSALLSLNESISFIENVNQVIPKREQGISYGEHLLLTIINRIDNPQSHNKFGDWFDSTILKRIYPVKKQYLSSQSFWNHWNNIDEKQINMIQELLLDSLIKQYDISEVCFDPTNFTTYIEEHENQEILQFGKSKDGRKGFRQVNLSLLVTKKEGIPLWHHTYDGNTPDVSEFKEFIKTLTNRISFFEKKCKKITLILDKGNNSQNNIKNINSKLHFYVVGSLKPSQFYNLFDIPLEEFSQEYITKKDKKVFHVSKIMGIYDGKKKVVVTYTNELAYKNRLRVDKALNKALNKLENLRGRIKKTKISRDELIIKINEIVQKTYVKGLIDYSLQKNYEGYKLRFSKNEEIYRKKEKSFGKNILFSDDLSLTSSQIVEIYNSKNIVEEQFKNLKDRHVISFTPMWCWTDKMIRIHAFTCVMALLFLRILVEKVHKGKIEMSQSQILEQLRKIKLTLFQMPKSEKIHTKITRLNKEQTQLAKIFNLRKYV